MGATQRQKALDWERKYHLEVYGVDIDKHKIGIPWYYIPPPYRQYILPKAEIEPKNPLTIAERKTPITIARIISPDTSKDLLIKATMQRYGKKDGKYKNPDELKKTLLQIKGA